MPPYIYKSVFFLILAPERGVFRIEIDDRIATLSSSLSLPLLLSFPPPNPLHLFFVLLFSLRLFSSSLPLLFRSDTRCAQITDSPGSARSPPWPFVVSFFRIEYTRIRFTMRHQVYELIDDKDKRLRDRIADKTIGHDRVRVQTRREFSSLRDNDDSLTGIYFKRENTHKVRTVRKIA